MDHGARGAMGPWGPWGSRGMGPGEPMGGVGGAGGSQLADRTCRCFGARPWGQEPWVHGSPLKSAERARATGPGAMGSWAMGPGKPWARARGNWCVFRARARARVRAHVECHVMELCQHPSKSCRPKPFPEPLMLLMLAPGFLKRNEASMMRALAPRPAAHHEHQRLRPPGMHGL